MNLAQKWEMYESGKRPVGIPPAYIPLRVEGGGSRIRPITIPLNGVGGERGGFTGWAVYRLAAASQERLGGSYLRLLHMATFTGVGALHLPRPGPGSPIHAEPRVTPINGGDPSPPITLVYWIGP